MRSNVLGKLRKTLLSSCRIYLAMMFLLYGAVKIFPGQFPTGPFVYDSTQDSAMMLAWRFFGYSQFYNYFIAAGEIVAALLLLLPRTATLGIVILLPITVNITVIDYCFDISAKSFSLFLTILAIIALLLETRKLLPLVAALPSAERSRQPL